MGSAVPWYEAMMLELGAASTVTLEYNRVTYHHASMQVCPLSLLNKSQSAGACPFPSPTDAPMDRYATWHNGI